MPYRSGPQQSEPTDPSGPTKEWKDRRARIEALAPEPLWTAPPILNWERGIEKTLVSRDGRRILVLAQGHGWLVDIAPFRFTDLGELGYGSAVAWSDDGTKLAYVNDGEVYIESLGSGEEARRMDLPRYVNSNATIGLSFDGSLLAVADREKRATVHVVDTTRGEQVYAFVANASRSLIAHPSGRLIICFGDDHAQAYTEKSTRVSFEADGIGCFNGDGSQLVLNQDKGITIRQVDVNASPMLDPGTQGRVASRSVHGINTSWGLDIRAVSPNDGYLLVHGRYNSDHALLDAEGNRLWTSRREAAPGSGFLADERVLVAADRMPIVFGKYDPQLAASLLDRKGHWLGGIGLVGHSDEHHLVAVDQEGTFGALSGALLSDGGAFERPQQIGPMLFDGKPLDQDDQRFLEEYIDRRNAWQRRSNRLLPEVDLRRLLIASAGLSHLLPVILQRSLALAEQQARFGPPLVSAAAVVDVCDALREASPSARAYLFDEMLAALDS